MRTLLALVVTILFTLYTVACVQIQLQWSFSSYLIKRSFSDDGINLLKISPFGVIPSDIHIVNESISNQLNNKDFSS